ncbi:MAG: hypothetical protein RIE77_04805 [Phycisphaerales bacterium]|jgi:hypothetical protein
MSSVRTGIDISPDAITAAQVRLNRSGWTLLHGVRMARRSGDGAVTPAEAVELESLLFRHGFKSAPCVINAPAEALKTTTMELPPATSGAPIDQLANAEFVQRTKLEPGTFELSYWGLPTPGPAVQVMAVGCEIAPTDEVIGALESAGLRVAGVDDPSRALGRVLAAAPTAATVRVGARLESWGVRIVVLHHSTLLYARTPAGLRLDGSQGDAEVGRRLATEIDACIAFARHRSRSHAPAAISVLGAGGEQAGIMDVLASRYQNAVAQPIDGNGQAVGGRFAAAIGLALLEDLA